MKTCTTCGNPLTGRQRKHCSPLCASRAFNKARAEDGRLKAERTKRADKIKAYNRANRGRWYIERICETCDQPYRTNRPDGRFCSTECRDAGRDWDLGVSQSRRQIAELRLRNAARGRKGKTWICGRCASCGEWFVGPNRSDLRYCTRICKNREARQRRRARALGATIVTVSDRLAIYERDGWICRLCDLPVNPDSDPNDLDAPTLDHIRPLALRGSHHPDNLQTAHRYCNSVKGASLIA